MLTAPFVIAHTRLMGKKFTLTLLLLARAADPIGATRDLTDPDQYSAPLSLETILSLDIQSAFPSYNYGLDLRLVTGRNHQSFWTGGPLP